MIRVDFNDPIHVHFIGIGGISMSGLAQILLDRGFPISGSDALPSDITDELIRKGAKISFPQSADNITDDIDLVVYTAAIHPDNPEFAAAKEKGLHMLTRAQLLGQIMEHYSESVSIAGTHGKTTTTGMCGQIMLESGKQPTISIGGIFPAIGGNIHVGDSDLFVTEACEYTNSYHEFYAKYAIILNIEEDHMDFFHDLEDIRSSFRRFAHLLKPDGVLVIGGAIEDLPYFTDGLEARVVTFGLTRECMFRAENITYQMNACAGFDLVVQDQRIGHVQLKIPGEHNVLNALAAIAAADFTASSKEPRRSTRPIAIARFPLHTLPSPIALIESCDKLRPSAQRRVNWS